MKAHLTRRRTRLNAAAAAAAVCHDALPLWLRAKSPHPPTPSIYLSIYLSFMTCQRSEVVLTRVPPFSRQTSSHFLSTHVFFKTFSFTFYFLLFILFFFFLLFVSYFSPALFSAGFLANHFSTYFSLMFTLLNLFKRVFCSCFHFFLFGHSNTNISFVPFTGNVFFFFIF